MNSAILSKFKSINMSKSTLLPLIFAVCLFHINIQVSAWGYPEDNCYSCYDDTRWGKDGMYFCRHSSSGLKWG